MFATTHTGSLPRPADLTPLLQSREDGTPPPDLDGVSREAVVEAVQQQVEAGCRRRQRRRDGQNRLLHVRHRSADGLRSRRRRPPAAPLRPGRVSRPARTIAAPCRPPSATRIRPCAPATSSPATPRRCRRTSPTLKIERAQAAGAEQLFMSAASPGVVSVFIPDQHYGNHASVRRRRSPRRCARSTAPSSMRASRSRSIARTWPWLASRYPQPGGVPHVRGDQRRGAEPRAAGLPPERVRVHICWGNYEGPHNHDVDLKDIIDIVLRANAAGLSVEACNPRHAHEWRVFEDTPLPEDRYVFPASSTPPTTSSNIRTSSPSGC